MNVIKKLSPRPRRKKLSLPDNSLFDCHRHGADNLSSKAELALLPLPIQNAFLHRSTECIMVCTLLQLLTAYPSYSCSMVYT